LNRFWYGTDRISVEHVLNGVPESFEVLQVGIEWQDQAVGALEN
jgi:hypothetical protein